ncbi:MAG: hypothetical protein IKK79_07470 [Spirochaetaceae bacterium]|nr:hypothetical protein [Spirochaetaceae bacterium]
MRKINVLMLLGIVSIFVFSCSHGLLKDPRLYNAKKTEKSAMAVAPEPELQLTGGVDTFDNTDQWYNNPNANGDESNPNKEDFPHTDFETMSLVGTYFNDSNVPVYAMRHENVWVSKDATKAEFVHAKAPDTEGQGYGISNVHWYQYRGRNPVYAADGNYNNVLQFTAKGNPKLSRFYFYRFTGDTLSPSLDNFLFAVDSYSKFMFAFAKPTASKSVFGNNVPTAWGPTDGSAFLGINYQFYMYDPVGYVEKVDGKYNVVMYDWFKNNLAKGEYQPTLGGLDDKSQGTVLTKVAEKKPDGQGTSPFNNHTVNFFEENMKLLGEAGVPFFRRETTPSGGNGLVLYKYVVSQDGKTITRTAESWNGLTTETDVSPKTYNVGEGESATKGKVSGENVATLELQDESRTLCFSNGEIASSVFTDPGPDWLLRVQGRSFETTDKTYKYCFSVDGRSVDYYKNGSKQETWTFYGIGEGNNAKAAYQGSGAIWKYWGFNLRNGDELYCTTGQGSTIHETLNMRTWADPAYLMRTQGSSFSDSVKGMSFGLRKKDVEQLRGLDVVWYRFDSTGQNVTIVTETYPSTTKSESYSVSSSEKETATINGKTVKLKITESKWVLVIDNDEYEANYQDYGPSFVNRVKGKSFSGDSVFYVFSEDGKTLDYYDMYLWWDFSYYWQKRTYTYDPNTLETYTDEGGIQVKYGGTWYTLGKRDTEISWWESSMNPTKNVATKVDKPTLPIID